MAVGAVAAQGAVGVQAEVLQCRSVVGRAVEVERAHGAVLRRGHASHRELAEAAAKGQPGGAVPGAGSATRQGAVFDVDTLFKVERRLHAVAQVFLATHAPHGGFLVVADHLRLAAEGLAQASVEASVQGHVGLGRGDARNGAENSQGDQGFIHGVIPVVVEKASASAPRKEDPTACRYCNNPM